jgi:hypothetical protein
MMPRYGLLHLTIKNWGFGFSSRLQVTNLVYVFKLHANVDK